jgi:hypothetical protein
MQLSRFYFLLAVISLSCGVFPRFLDARQKKVEVDPRDFNSIFHTSQIFSNFPIAFKVDKFHCASNENNDINTVEKPTDGGIKEIIPDKFQERYRKWKAEFLSTEPGRQQWESYLNNKHFILTITIVSSEGQGAGTGKYQWDETGQLVGATITLGNKIDKGLPDPIYFPVMNSLSLEDPSYSVNGNILAATKFAHEFGHVNQTAKMKGSIFQLQNKLMPVYNEILLKNGYKTQDQKLIDLVKQMGGTPVEIWENREYWGEANAMLFLADRINKESYHCAVYNKMRQNVKLYANDYEKRFVQIAEAKNFEAICSK